MRTCYHSPLTIHHSPLTLMALALVCLAGEGCSGRREPAPTLYPVTGRVSFKGGEPLPGGAIEFRSQADPAWTTMAEIHKDGTFALFTSVQNEQLEGAVEGPHQVMILLPMSDNRVVEPIIVPQFYTVEPKQNHFAIEVERPAGWVDGPARR